MPDDAAAIYQSTAASRSAFRLGEIAQVGIGYVTGSNDFFHLRPSIASSLGIPARFLRPSVRNGRSLNTHSITRATIDRWRRDDEPNFLLRVRRTDDLPIEVRRYLNSEFGKRAQASYKCRNRKPWYVVPNVYKPDAFLSYMVDANPALVANAAGCVATNSVHIVRMRNGFDVPTLQGIWPHAITRLSFEVEGHPLGGGLLKLEPGEAARVLLSTAPIRDRLIQKMFLDSVELMRRWRHHG